MPIVTAITGARRDWNQRSVIHPDASAPRPPASGKTATLRPARSTPEPWSFFR